MSEAAEWETIAVLPTCRLAALGSAEMRDHDWAKGRIAHLKCNALQFGMLYVQADVENMPVEVARVGQKIVAARLEFVDGIDRLRMRGRGVWAYYGRLKVSRRGAVAFDKLADDPVVELALPPGWYTAAAFVEGRDEFLGLLLAAE